MQTDIDVLKSKAQSCRRYGTFLLSNAEISNFWIDINEFNSYQVINSLIKISALFLKNYYLQFGCFTLAIPKYNNSSEKMFPLDYILNSAIEKSKLGEQINKLDVFCMNEGSDLSIEGDCKNIPCVVGIAVSVHITTLLKIIETLEKKGLLVSCVYTFLCRDKYSIKLLADKQIVLIPILYATSKQIYSIKELSIFQENEKEVFELGIKKDLFEGEL